MQKFNLWAFPAVFVTEAMLEHWVLFEPFTIGRA